MIALPYALLDRICDLGARLDEAAAFALAEVVRNCRNGQETAAARRTAALLLDAGNKGRFEILLDTWELAAPATSGREIAAALCAAAVAGRQPPGK